MAANQRPVAGDRVRLREATLDDSDLLERWQAPGYLGEFNDFGLPRRPVRAAIEENRLGGPDRGILIVEVVPEDRPIGTVSWHAVRHGPNPESSAWNIGINLVPDGRGRGYGADAQRLLAEHLLATTPVNRIEATTDVENTAEQRSLERAGFQREGVLRGAQFRAGGWHDVVLYAVVRPIAPSARPSADRAERERTAGHQA